MNVEQSATYVALRNKRDALLAQIVPLEVERDALRKIVDAAEREWRAKCEEIVALERAGNLRAICMELAALARSMGAYSLKVAGG